MRYSSDVWFCAFLLSRGLKMAKFDILDRNKVKCYFDLSDAEWKQHKLEFSNSDIIKFKGLIEQIKDLSY